MSGKAFNYLAFESSAFDVDTTANSVASQTIALPAQTATATVIVALRTGVVGAFDAIAFEATTFNVVTGDAQAVTIPDQTFGVVGLVSAALDEAIAVPTQTASSTVEIGVAASQSVTIPGQSAAATVLVEAAATQTQAAPTSAGTSDVDLAAASSQTIAVPMQNVVVWHPDSRAQKFRCKRFGYEFTARRRPSVQRLRRAA